ncbi:MAG: hypothetical protein JO291_12970 [Acidimicrobiia bacterium]|nr:hypothetical protein [Acidimicrobiia bacterium]
MSMSYPGGRVPRLGDRKAVDQSGQLVVKRQGRFGRVKEIVIPVHILDVSISGASLRAGREEEITPKQLALLDVGGDTGNVRVIWMRPEDESHVALGVQFLDPRPAFLPTLYRWLGRETALGPLDEG